MRSDTIFTPPPPSENRQKGKYTPSDSSTSEIRYYFYPPGQRQKGKFTPSEIRYYVYPPPSPRQKQKGKFTLLLHLKPQDVR